MHLLRLIILFKMFFLQNNFREEVVEKVKWNIDRESMQTKHRGFVDLIKPLKDDLSHQVFIVMAI